MAKKQAQCQEQQGDQGTNQYEHRGRPEVGLAKPAGRQENTQELGHGDLCVFLKDAVAKYRDQNARTQQ